MNPTNNSLKDLGIDLTINNFFMARFFTSPQIIELEYKIDKLSINLTSDLFQAVMKKQGRNDVIKFVSEYEKNFFSIAGGSFYEESIEKQFVDLISIFANEKKEKQKKKKMLLIIQHIQSMAKDALKIKHLIDNKDVFLE